MQIISFLKEDSALYILLDTSHTSTSLRITKINPMHRSQSLGWDLWIGLKRIWTYPKPTYQISNKTKSFFGVSKTSEDTKGKVGFVLIIFFLLSAFPYSILNIQHEAMRFSSFGVPDPTDIQKPWKAQTAQSHHPKNKNWAEWQIGIQMFTSTRQQEPE